MGTKKTIQSPQGTFEVDISDEACEKFGFKHGDRILHVETNSTAKVEGVGPNKGTSEPILLWVSENPLVQSYLSLGIRMEEIGEYELAK
jgi:hypothetical protein